METLAVMVLGADHRVGGSEQGEVEVDAEGVEDCASDKAISRERRRAREVVKAIGEETGAVE